MGVRDVRRLCSDFGPTLVSLCKQGAWLCAGPLPAWHDKITPEMEGVLRAVSKVTGDCLDAPEMSLFQPLLGSLSPDALLAVGRPKALFLHTRPADI